MKTLAVLSSLILFVPLSAFAQSPQIVSTSPVQNQLGVDHATAISVTFDMAMDQGSINENTFRVNSSTTGLHTGSVSYDPDTRMATLIPDAGFAYAEVATIVLTDEILSYGGVPLASGYAWSFTVKVRSGSGAFALDDTYTTGSPFCLIAADLDNDGDNDLALADGGAQVVRVHYNNGSGGFNSSRSFATARSSYSVCAADFDGDGNIDLAASSGYPYSNNFSILLNDGNGDFGQRRSYAIHNDGTNIIAADLDGDGDMDLAAAGEFSRRVSVLFNDGEAFFDDDSTYITDNVPLTIRAGDIDGDGDLDLATANEQSQNISFFYNDGDGRFTQVDLPTQRASLSLELIDLDSDGDIDVAIANYNYLSALFNNGDGTFTPGQEYELDSDSYGTFAADFDNDDDIDMAAVSWHPETITINLNNGDGTFSGNAVYQTGGEGWAITGADFDGDGDIDLATVNPGANTVSILLNTSLPYSEIRGRVIDDYGNPLTGVLVSIPGMFFTHTDSNGDYLLPGVEAGLYDVSFAMGHFVPVTVNEIEVPYQTSVIVDAAMVGIPGQIISVSPTPNTADAPTAGNIAIEFDSYMDASTINNNSLLVYSRSLGYRAGMITYDGQSKAVTFDPTIDFTGGDIITVVLTRDIHFAWGTPLERDYIWSFTTRAMYASGTFTPHTDYSAGEQPAAVLAGDFDGDGDHDLASANSASNDISVRMNNGDGSFGPASTYQSGGSPTAIAGADFNRDGDFDLATANTGTNNVSVFLNNGAGIFALQATLAVGQQPAGIFASDFDGDGDIDLAVANNSPDGISVLLNNGDADFASAENYPVGANSVSIFGGDIDNDGDLDLATANELSANVSVILNNGDGVFGPYSTFGVEQYPKSIYAADLNDDGYLDLAAANRSPSNNISILLNDGSGGYAPYFSIPVGEGANPLSVIAADVDGDGDPDLVTANSLFDNVMTFLNDGDAGFMSTSAFAVGSGPACLYAADLDGDDDLDLSVANGTSDNISILLNIDLPPGTVSGLVVNELYGPVKGVRVNAIGTSIADTTGIDGGYRLEGFELGNYDIQFIHQYYVDTTVQAVLVIPGSTSYLNVVMHRELVELLSSEPGQNELNVAASTNITVVFDIDMDPLTINDSTFMVRGLTTGIRAGTISYDSESQTAVFNPASDFAAGEVVTVELTLEIRSYWGTPLSRSHVWSFTVEAVAGSGDFEPRQDYAAGNGPNSVMAADFDRDGDLDLATAYWERLIATLQNDGTGAFGDFLETGTDYSAHYLCAGDFDNDGYLDIAIGNWAYYGLSVLFNSGDGTFGNIQTYWAGEYATGICAADFNGDGDPDIALSKGWIGRVAIFLNQGDGVFGPYEDCLVDNWPYGIAAADLDGDDDIDLAIADAGEGMSVLLNQGDGTFVIFGEYELTGYVYSITAADFNADTNLDLAATSSELGCVAVWLNNGDGTFLARADYGGGIDPRSVFTGDFDSDGDLDLVSVNYNADEISVLPNNGDGTFGPRITFDTGELPNSIFAADYNNDGSTDLAVANGRSDSVSIHLNINQLVTSARNGQLPLSYSLAQNHPNPFNARTTIQYALPEAGPVKIEVYDLLGRRVGQPVDEFVPAGYHRLVWDAGNLATGVYFYKIQAGDYSESKKMVVVK